MTPPKLTDEQESAIKEYLLRPSPNINFRRPPTLKIFITGPRGSGNSSVLNALMGQNAFGEYDPTLEDSYRKQITIHDQRVMVEYTNLPLAAPESALWAHYLREAHALILLYDVNDRHSFELLQKCYEKQSKPTWVLANKADLSQQVTQQEGEAFAKAIGARFWGVSAKTGEGLGEEDVVAIVKGVILSRLEDEARGNYEKKEEGGENERVGKKIPSRWSLNGMRGRLKGLLRRDTK